MTDARTVGDVRGEIGETRVDGQHRNHASTSSSGGCGWQCFRFIHEGLDDPSRVKARSTIVGDEERGIRGSVDDHRVHVRHVF